MQNNRLPPELKKAVLESRVLLFLGPEVSTLAGVDTRARLGEALATALRQRVGSKEAAEVEAFLGRAALAELAQAARLEMGQEAYIHLAQSVLDRPEALPPRLLFALRGLPIRRWLTTAIDGVAERALSGFAEDDDAVRVIVPDPGVDAPIPDTERGYTLIKLFGDARNPESMVLATDDLEAYFRRRPRLVERLTALLETHVPLFIGFAPDDTEFRRLYSLIGARLAANRQRGYALMTGITRFDIQWWARRSLRLIGFEGFSELEGAVRQLVRYVNTYHSPGVAVEREQAPLAQGGGAEGSNLELNLAKAQLRWVKETFTWYCNDGQGDPIGQWVATALSPESGPRATREDRLTTLLADGEPDAPSRLQGSTTVSIEDVVGQGSRVVITGPTGSGKTALLINLLARFNEDAVAGGARTLAFYLPVRDLTAAEFDPEPDLLGRLTAQLRRLTPTMSAERILDTVQRALSEDRVLLLLDGLDQVPADAVAGVRDVLERLRRAYRDANIIITCRTGAWSPELLPDLPVYEMLPLDTEAQANLIRRRVGASDPRTEALIGGLRSGFVQWAAERASNPFDLTLLADHFVLTGDVPPTASALYDRVLMSRLKSPAEMSGADLTAWDLRCAAEALAMHSLSEPAELLVDPRMKQVIADSRPEGAPGSQPVDAGLILDALRGEGGLLVGPSVHGTWEFRFPLMQEYLVASRLTRKDEPTRRKTIQAHTADPLWRGVWRLLAEQLDDGTPVVSALLASTEAHTRQAVPGAVRASRRLDRRWVEEALLGDSGLAGHIAQSLGSQLEADHQLSVFSAVLDRDKSRHEADGDRLAARVVWVALEALARLAHTSGPLARQAAASIAAWQAPRPAGHSGPWPQENKVIEAGAFLHERGGQEPTTSHRQLGPYLIASTPVTVSLWRSFHPKHPMAHAREPFTDDNHPAVGMSWYEAMVCARWYGGRLPTEPEWDKAAAWSPSAERRRAYPWGNTWDPSRCNTLETWEGGQGSTTPVDQFGESGASAFGCREMAGNVLEWTSTQAPGPVERQVLRGGSWMASAAFARNGAAVWLAPGVRSMAVGFRLAFGRPTE